MDSKTSDSIVTAIGINIGKNTFHLVGLDERRSIVLRRKFSRGQVAARLANMAPCLVGMEACVGVHHLTFRRKTHRGGQCRRRNRGLRSPD